MLRQFLNDNLLLIHIPKYLIAFLGTIRMSFRFGLHFIWRRFQLISHYPLYNQFNGVSDPYTTVQCCPTLRLVTNRAHTQQADFRPENPASEYRRGGHSRDDILNINR